MADINKIDNKNLPITFSEGLRLANKQKVRGGDKNILNKNTNPPVGGFERGDLYKNSIRNLKSQTWRCVLIKIRTWFQENPGEFDSAPFASFFKKDY